MIKLVDAVNFNTFYTAVQNQKMPASLAYKLAKLASHTLAPEQKLYSERLRDTVLSYAVLDENGQPQAADNIFGVQIKAGEEGNLMRDITDLQNVALEVQPVFTLEELASLTATPEQFQAALPFIIETAEN